MKMNKMSPLLLLLVFWAQSFGHFSHLFLIVTFTYEMYPSIINIQTTQGGELIRSRCVNINYNFVYQGKNLLEHLQQWLWSMVKVMSVDDDDDDDSNH